MALVLKSVEDTIGRCKDLNKYVKEGFEVTKSIAEDCEDEENGKEFANEIRDLMLDYASMERDVEQYVTAAHKTMGKFRTQYASLGDDTDANIPNLFEMFETTLQSIQATNTVEQIEQHKEVQDFMKTVWSLHNPEAPEDGAQSNVNTGADDDDDIMISQSEDPLKYICPITKVEFVDPVKCTLCAHTYSRKGIEAHIKAAGKRAKCPIPGCVSKDCITLEHLEPNNVLAFELRKKNKRL